MSIKIVKKIVQIKKLKFYFMGHQLMLLQVFYQPNLEMLGVIFLEKEFILQMN